MNQKMSPDEIEYNVFYHLLQTKYRKKYEPAISKCCMICIPCSAALRGVEITDEFVDMHILQPVSRTASSFISGSGVKKYCYELKGSLLTLIASPMKLPEEYVIKVLSVETGYNKEYQQYKILITDKPLSPEFQSKPPGDDMPHLEMKITCLNDATQFLSRAFSLHGNLLLSLDTDLQNLAASPPPADDIVGLQGKIRNLLNVHWVSLLKTHPLECQRDARFQVQLSAALEIYMVNQLHSLVFPALCALYKEEDAEIYTHLQKLSNHGVTPDQLGAPVDLAVPLPAAVVELASLDAHECPANKLGCLRATMELMMAELKGAIVDAHSEVAEEGQLPALTSDDTLPLLMSVIIQAKPLHMASNLFYMENFQWTLSPNDVNSYCLVTFKAAVQELLSLDPAALQPRSEKVVREMGLEDLFKVTSEIDSNHRHKDGKTSGPVSPLDRQRERVTAMIEASTRELREIMPSSGSC
ncbi:ankyrin repeat domain-containing protein 27-like isoform X1 [Schistocerca serialis cubense]|uniref:ankyrin repeat domain-containing protein 27-like isoform X1 n=1 Tax=Schistocerca serialis cubense TaxID=2023355 RepID=UPI00214E703F|nr:ankyrin repeat domain-containing protein 27-like isoform X1 [Schistocerca serialis cubense]